MYVCMYMIDELIDLGLQCGGWEMGDEGWSDGNKIWNGRRLHFS